MNKSSILRAILASIILLVLFSILGTFYMRNTSNLLNSETEMHVREVANQGSRLIKSKLENSSEVVRVLASGIVSNPNVSMEDKLLRLKIETDRNNFIRMGYATLDGNAITTDGKEFYIGDRDYFINSSKGNNSISNILSDRISSQDPIIVYSVPIKYNNEIVGVLFATASTKTISESIEASFFGMTGYSYVCDSSGTVVFYPKNQQYKSSIMELMKENTNIDKLRSELKNNNSGATRLTLDDKDKYLGYAPIEGVNDWSLIFVVPSDVVFNKSSEILKQTQYLVILLCFIFLSIIAYISIIKWKNNKKMLSVAFTDKLTGISNYNKFYADSKKILENKNNKNYCLIYFDINNFKIINDTFGYSIGNKILKFIADLLQDNLKNGELFGRLSNDYFAILLQYKDVNQDVISIINYIENNLNNRTIHGYSIIDISICTGVYMIPRGETDVNKIINKANMARVTIKKNPHITYKIFNEDIRNSLSEEINMENEIKIALFKNQFDIYYQPKISLDNCEIISAEALIRWIHPQKGFISPGIFIPIAEKNGLIVEISRFVFERVCKDLSQWREEGSNIIPVSVNISRSDLYQKDLTTFLESTLAKYNIPPNLIEIELTETAVLNDLDFIKSVIDKFKEIGFTVSMDDFGTGYSSLSCLKSIPIDILKLDRSFIIDIESDARSKNVIISIINLAKSLDLTVVSEGVETKEQVEFLTKSGCHIAQGYYFSKPLSKKYFEEFINS